MACLGPCGKLCCTRRACNSAPDMAAYSMQSFTSGCMCRRCMPGGRRASEGLLRVADQTFRACFSWLGACASRFVLEVLPAALWPVQVCCSLGAAF